MVNRMDPEPFPRPPAATGLLDAAPPDLASEPADAFLQNAAEPLPQRLGGGAGEGAAGEEGAATQAARRYDRGRDPSLPGPRHNPFLDGLNPAAGSLLGSGTLERGLEEARERVHRR